MQLIEPKDLAEFNTILREHHFRRSDFSLNALDTTDPKTDEVPAMQGELTVERKSTGKSRQYMISDRASWLDRFRHDMSLGVFAGQRNIGKTLQSRRQAS